MKPSLAIFNKSSKPSSNDIYIIQDLLKSHDIVLYVCSTDTELNRSYEAKSKLFSDYNLRAAGTVGYNSEFYVFSKTKLNDIFGFKNTREIQSKISRIDDLFGLAMREQDRILIFVEKPDIELAKTAMHRGINFRFEGNGREICSELFNKWREKLPDQPELPFNDK